MERDPPTPMGAVALSVLVPALNEADNIAAALRGVLAVADALGIDVEVLALSCVDADGTSDGTDDVVRRAAAEDGRIRFEHVARYQSLGEKLRRGIALATKAHFVMIPGDNENDPDSYRDALARIGSADVIVCYPANPEIRPWHRRVLSRTYTALVNAAFGRRLRYYNGMNVYRTDHLRELVPASESFALGAEALLRLFAAGHTYVEVPVRLQPRRGRSKALRPAHVRRVVVELVRLRFALGRAPRR